MKFKDMTFKKRYLLFGIIALEVVSIPVSAQIIDKVAFSVPQRAIAVPFPPEPGLAKFLVSSNAPFAVVAENTIGEFEVSIQVSGVLNGNRFGDNAQMPGEAQTCAAQISPSATKIYEGDRKTAAQKGDILTQAVIVEIRYDADTSPAFKVMTEDDASKLPQGHACEATLS